MTRPFHGYQSSDLVTLTLKFDLHLTRHVFVKHRWPWWQQSQNIAKICKSYILTLPHPKGHGMSMKCEEPIDELTIQVWLLYHDPNLKYCTLFVSGTELRTETDDPITRCPQRTSQAGGIKNFNFGHSYLTRRVRDFILHMYIPCAKTFPLVPKLLI